MLKKRFLTALIGLPPLIVAIWFDVPLPWFSVLVAVWSLLAVNEFYRLSGVLKVASLTCFGFIWTLLFVISPHVAQILTVPRVLSSAIVLSLVVLLFRRQKEGAFATWVWTLAGMLYVGWLLSYLVALRLDGGREWVFLALFATFGSDTTAFFVGRAVGKHRLAPSISPAKTWEGAVGGVLGSIAVSLAVDAIFKMPLNYAQVIFFGLVVSVMAQLGDLAESLLKRNLGAKESGTLMPGHGGILDRTDSIIFAGVTAYYFFLAFDSGWLSWLS